MMNSNINRIAKNTVALYIRMVLLTIISLFTYRVIYRSLGASDYGTYNVVGGFVSMFGFITGVMTATSQRYYALDLANDDWKKVSKTLSMNIVVYSILCLFVLLISETFGLWFVTHKLNVDYGRMNEIIIVYQTSIIIFIFGIMASPFTALLVADENLKVYAYISLFEGFFKIIVAFVMYFFDNNRLVIYSFLVLLLQTIVYSIYIIYCLRKYKKIEFHLVKNFAEYKGMASYINWNMIGALAHVGKNHGTNIIINIYFGTLINAARGIASQLNSTISSFAQNFMKAVDPRIIKNYGNNNKEAFMSSIFISSKMSFYLLLIVAIPFIANVDFVLILWLVEVPEYARIFSILALIDALVLSITDPLLTAVQAVGKMKTYQLTVGILSLLNLPITYIILRYYTVPVVPFVVAIIIDVFITIGRMINLKKLYNFSIGKYCLEVIVPAIIVTILSAIFSIFILGNAVSFVNLLVHVVFSVALMLPLILFIGLSKKERSIVFGMINDFLKKGRDGKSIFEQ